MYLAPDRVVDGRPAGMFGPSPEPRTLGRANRPGAQTDVPDAPASKVARLEPDPEPERRTGSTKNLSDWERWLEFCARMDGYPRHLSIHSGGMLVTAAPLIDIAPLERATMPNRVVTQYDKRDIETLKLIKLDLLGLGMLAAIDETLQLIQHDCAVCLDLDRMPEEIPEVFAMLQAADTVGVFQVESRAQMQTLPKSRPQNLDDLVVEVAIIRPGPIQGNAVHPYLRRKQGLEPVTYPHPALEPILADTLGVILYQEQVMEIAIRVAGFSPADSDGFRRAMGTWRSSREMEKLHRRFVDGCVTLSGMLEEPAEELFRQVAAFASFGFAKSHAAAFARTAYESSFLKLFYPAQFTVGLINAQPMGFYPIEVLVNDAKRHGVAVLPVDLNASSYQTTTEWVGRPGWAIAGQAGDDGSHDTDPGEPLPEGAGIDARPRPVRSSACVNPATAAREQWAAESATGYAVRLGLRLVKGIGEEQAERLDAELARGPYRSLADVVERTGLSEEVIERLIRTGALDSLGRPRRSCCGSCARSAGRRAVESTVAWPERSAGPRSARRGDRWTSGCRRHRPRAAGDQRAGAARRLLRGDLTRREKAGRGAVPAGARPAGSGAECGPGRPPAGTGPAGRPRRHAAASDDRPRHGLPGPGRRDGHGQRDPLARHLGATAWRGPAPRAAARRRNAPARRQRRERHCPRGPGAAGGCRDGWRPRTTARSQATRLRRNATPGVGVRPLLTCGERARETDGRAALPGAGRSSSTDRGSAGSSRQRRRSAPRTAPTRRSTG